MSNQAIMNTNKNLYSINDASVYIGTDTSTIEDLIHCGDLPAFGSKKNMIRLVDLNSFMNSDNTTIIEEHSKSDMLFKDYFLSYLKKQDGGVRSRTFSNYVNVSHHIIDDLGNYKLCEINKNILQTFINNLCKKKYKKGITESYYGQSLINKVYDLLKGAISEASDEDGDQLLRTNFMSNIKKPRTNKFSSKDHKALTDEEIRKVASVISENQMVNLWIHLLLYTGVRPSEALALKFDDIDYINKTIDIHQTLSHEDFIDPVTKKSTSPSAPLITTLKNERENKKENYQRRTLRVTDNLLLMLKNWESTIRSNDNLLELKRIHGTSDFLFCGSKGQFWLYENYKQVYERLLERHGLYITNFNPYRYRHSYCTNILKYGIDLKSVQMIMGDNSPDMVLQVYANMSKDDVLNGSGKYSDNMDKILFIPDKSKSILVKK